jgi:RHS repeat-associated protein
MFQLTGTAVQGLEAHSTAEYVEIDGNGTYLYAEKQETQPLDSLGSPTSERSVSYTDGRGLTLRRENAAGQIRWTQVNTSGQVVEEVDEDGVTNRISYNFKGEVDYSGIDSDGSGSLTASSLDRIKYSLSYVTNVSGVAYRYSFRQEFPTNNSAAVLTTAESWATLDGFQTWTVAFGLTNRTVTSINRGTQTRTVTRYNPDGSYTVDVFVSGRPSTSTRYDSASAQIGKTTYGYDFHGRRTSSTDARNGATTLAYNSADLIVSLTSPVPGNGDPNQVTTSQYNSSGRAWKVIQPDGTSTTNEFFPTGQLKKTYGSRTYPVEYTYDSVGRMATMKTWRDFVGNSGAATTAWTYDNTGRMTAKTYADSSAIAYTYTPAGRLKSRTWARNSTTTYFYDFEDVSPTRRNGDLVQIAYDDGVTPLVRYGIDRRGRRTSVAQWSPDGSTLLNTASQTLQPSGVMTSESHSGGPLNNMSVAFAYDSLLRRTNLTARQTGSSVVLSTRYGYDLASRLNLVGDSTNDVSYARLGNSDMIGTVTHKQGANTRLATARSYDYLNRLNSTFSTPSSSGQPVFGSAYVYNAANQRKRQGLGDGSYWMYEYDALGQVVAGRRYWGDGTPVAGQQFEYAFDDIGNRKNTKAGGDAAGANVRQATYSVNSLNLYTSRSNPRYLEVQGSARSTGTVQVDGSTTGVIRQGEYFRKELGAIGGTGALWQSVTVGLSGGTNTGSKSLFLPPATESYTYDADGNLTADGQWTYAWDAENRLIEIASKLSAGVPLSPTTLARRITYRYDGQSRQLERVEFTWNTGTAAWNTTPAATTRYLYDGWNCVAEFSVSGATVTHQRSYLWGLDMSGSMAGAGGVGGLLAIYQGPMSGPAVHYTAYDGNGNVIGLVKAADGNVSARYEYGPFGEPLRGTGEAIAAANPWRFSTKRADPVTTLVHYEYRVYNPTTGRWLGRDPIGERHSLGLLVFLSNQSLSSIDRFGLLDLRDGSTFTPTGDGHHIIPKHLWNCLGFSQDAAEFLDSSEARIPVSYHHDRTRHNIYDNNVAEEIERFMKSEKGKSLLKGCGKNCILDRNAAQEILNHVKSSQNQYVRTFLDNVGKSKEELARAMDALPTSMAQRCSKVFSWCAKAGKCLAVAAPFLGHASAQQRAEAAVEAGHSVSAGVLLYAVEQISPISPSEVRDTVREMKSEFDECGNRIGERRFGRLLD